MMRTLKLLVVILYVSLLLAAVWLLPQSQNLLAATGTANCPGGITVSCNAYRCVCTDNVGCTGYDASGNIIESQTKPCVVESSTAYAQLGSYNSTAAELPHLLGDDADVPSAGSWPTR
jgi:hypothetical protein